MWTAIGAWALVVALAFGAHLFGREARETPSDRADARMVQRSRIGVAMSSQGPLLLLVAGLLIAAVTAWWVPVALVTCSAIVIVTLAGLYLAPD